MKKIFFYPTLTLIIFLLNNFFSVAQTDSDTAKIVNCNPNVQWTYEVKKVGGGEFDIVLHAAIAKGWHLYGTKEVANQIPIPTSIMFEKNDNYTTEGDLIESSKADEKYDSTSEMKLFLFENNAVFTQRIKLLKDDAVVKTKIYFMLCNDHMCMAPCNQFLDVEVKK